MDKNVLKDKWEPVENVDYSKRKPKEWAKIYNIHLLEEIDGIWSEYEFAYMLSSLKYRPLADETNSNIEFDSYEKSALMELRALELRRDLFYGADPGELSILRDDKLYVETHWVKRKLNLI